MIQPHARATDPDTSHAAAESMVKPAEAQRRKILASLKRHGPATADEIDERIGWRPTTAGRRMKELVEVGKLRDTGDLLLTRSGRRATVYAVPSGALQGILHGIFSEQHITERGD